MREISKNQKRGAAAAALISSVGLWGLASATAPAPAQAGLLPTVTSSHLRSLNNSGVLGNATVTVNGRQIHVEVNARHLLRHAPHAMHLHFSARSDHDCPTVRDDRNHDHRLNVVEGQPSYGKIQASLTTRGAHGPGSGLAVNRFPHARHGKIHYDRTFRVSQRLANKIAAGKVAVVIHGIDYNNNHKYDFKAGKSELDPAIPTEATDPVACGVLKEQPIL
jgi:hypothetical protein